MGAYGSPELFPPDDNLAPKFTRKKASFGKIILISVGFIFYLFLGLFMYSGLVTLYMPWIFQGHSIFIIPVIASLIYAVSMPIFFVNYARGKDCKKYLGYSAISVAIFMFLVGFNPNTELNNQVNNQVNNSPRIVKPDIKPQVTLEEYKTLCSSYDYKDVARNPQNYVSKKAAFTGQVQWTQEIDDYVIMVVAVTEGEYYWDDGIYIEYQRKSNTESRILQNDIITMYGTLNGIKTYTAIDNSSVSLPHLLVEFVEIKTE